MRAACPRFLMQPSEPCGRQTGFGGCSARSKSAWGYLLQKLLWQVGRLNPYILLISISLPFVYQSMLHKWGDIPVYTHIYTYIYIYIYIFMYLSMHVCIYIYIHTFKGLDGFGVQCKGVIGIPSPKWQFPKIRPPFLGARGVTRICGPFPSNSMSVQMLGSSIKPEYYRTPSKQVLRTTRSQEF